MSTSTAIFDLISTLVDARPIRADVVAKTTKAKLQRVAEESNDYFSILRGAVSTNGPLKSVEVRIPTPQASAKDGMVLLDVRTDVCTSKKETMSRFGQNPELSVPTPRQPPDAPVYLVYRYDWGVLRFGFERTGKECLKAIVLDATDPPSH